MELRIPTMKVYERVYLSIVANIPFGLIKFGENPGPRLYDDRDQRYWSRGNDQKGGLEIHSVDAII